MLIIPFVVNTDFWQVKNKKYTKSGNLVANSAIQWPLFTQVYRVSFTVQKEKIGSFERKYIKAQQ